MREKNNNNFASAEQREAFFLDLYKKAFHSAASYIARMGGSLDEAFYYDALPVVDVASLFGYSGTHSATVAKYKCLEKVRETVKQKSLNYADFIE